MVTKEQVKALVDKLEEDFVTTVDTGVKIASFDEAGLEQKYHRFGEQTKGGDVFYVAFIGLPVWNSEDLTDDVTIEDVEETVIKNVTRKLGLFPDLKLLEKE